MTTPAPTASSAAAVPPVVAVAYHSGYGHTAVLAEAVRDGAADAGATVHLVKVDEIAEEQWGLLDAADAIVFGSPTYMGTASGAFHVFAEATSKRYVSRAWQDKLAAGFTNSGSKSGDKLHTLQFFTVLAAQTDTDRGPDGVHKADIATADHLGRRVAAQAAVYAAGRAAVAA
ncbi:flavodoxin family protein [Streptomyces rimosus]|uniref:flavodoxin family protein n=2 Tax=Streptomyces rimosus TaxID=1927 RepID=UPI0004C57E41|nr:flavodoxin family protein [Streptomyces rimosus]